MYNDSLICTAEIEIELREIENEGTSLALKISLMSQKIKYIFFKIESCNSIQSAAEYFDLLDKMQMCLATLVFKHEIGIPDRLHRFVQDFDNIDHYKDYLFEQIKSGKYSF